MIIGVPKEIKTNENRIALVPAGAESFVGQGHTVYVEKGAGVGSGFGLSLIFCWGRANSRCLANIKSRI